MNNNTVTKKNLRDYMSLRKNVYIGNCTTNLIDFWIIENDKLIYKKIPFNEGYFKLIDEIISNSVDENIKTNGKFSKNIDVEFDSDRYITVTDTGRGIPFQKDKESGVYQIKLAFCDIHTGSNWERSLSIGMNGIGASAVNYLSSHFEVFSCDGKWMAHLVCKNRCESVSLNSKKYNIRGTKVKFKIDENEFDGISEVPNSIIESLLYKRLVELKTAYPNINFTFNLQPITKKITDFIDFDGQIIEKKNVAVGVYYNHNGDVDDISYVNGLYTFRGGSHLKYFKNYFIEYVREKFSKKYKDVQIKNSQIANKFIFYVSLNSFEKAEFDNQNKTRLENKENEIQKHFEQSSVSLDQICKYFYELFENKIDDIFDNITASNISKKIKEGSKSIKNIKHIPTFTDAIDSNRKDTILFLVEGESAKSHFPKVRNKQKHGLLQLRGKILNAYETSLSNILENKEIVNLMNIVGLEIGKQNLNLYFDKIAILTDADVDGHHISLLLMVFFYKYFPYLFEQRKIIKVLSPIVICRHKRGNKIERFYNYSDFVKVQHKYTEENGWEKPEYNKGLGALTEEEYSYMINNLKYDVITLGDIKKINHMMDNLFNKKKADIRKLWLQGKNIYEL